MLQMTHRTVEGIDVIELSGRFDAHQVPFVVRWFDDHPEIQTILVNLKGVNFIDSSGLATLVKGLKRCRQNGGELYLCEAQQAVRIILELTRLDKAFTIFVDEQTAFQAITR
ncbi:MAG: STAS domain-containing protein [Chloroflexaceae bacterium]|nr:STAS domain-containing protein [Chloroflexaceae bacterium]NJL34610.1 STAS domain-containing protein [Chloroflexaceae bacterium]NJO05916.1 STAS domain-containing protein [Chloroflexaceae bacterium]